MFIPVYRFVSGLLILLIIAGCSSQTELEWNREAGYSWADLEPGFFGSTGFRQLNSTKTNIQFRNDVRRDLIDENRNYLNGSGVAVADVDGDGLVDIYFSGLDGPNKLYRNLGNFTFEDITGQAGVAHHGYSSSGVAFADVNGDGYPDLLVTSILEGNTLYLNDGSGTFTLKEDSGLGASNGSESMALADINGDGLLDLYIVNYKRKTVRDMYGPNELLVENTVEVRDGTLRVIPPFDEYYIMIETEKGSFRNEIAEADELYLNNGEGTFSRVNPEEYFFDRDGRPSGLPRDWGLSATFRDVNGDMYPDLYVTNDFWTPDRFWINRGDGTFRAIDSTAIRNQSFFAMGIDFTDINKDGAIDFVVTEMLDQRHSTKIRQMSETLHGYEGRDHYNRNSLYVNRGDMTFAQLAEYSGLAASGWSWATWFLDINLNGHEDLVIANGFEYDYQDMDTQMAMDELDAVSSQATGDILDYPLLRQVNKFFMNNGDLTFTDMSEEWGFSKEDVSMGMALADLNNDGSLDLIINRFNDEAALFENRTNAPRIAVRLKGNSPNTEGIGAKIELEGGPVIQRKEIISGGNYLSGSQPQVVFAADPGNDNHVITVTWRDGKRSRVSGVTANRIYEIDESAAADAVPAGESEADGNPMFLDISGRLGHDHVENEYDDFRYGPLLPLKLSRLGPGVAWMDINGNGRDELLIGSSKDGEPALFEYRSSGNFDRVTHSPVTDPVPGDLTGIIGWKENGRTRVVVGSANYEQGDPDAPSAMIYSFGREDSLPNRTEAWSDPDSATAGLPGVLSTTGPVAASDIDGDGYVDLFVGGRFIPGQYPADADSRLFINRNGDFFVDTNNSRLLTGLGLVTGALFSDFTSDGRQDLLVSTEWGTLRLFENNNGIFRDITSDRGLDGWSGWWNGIATGDFNNDGLPDIVAVNIGQNSPYRIDSNNPLRLFYEDLNWNGRLDIVDSYYDEEIGGYVPRRRLSDFESIPTILQNVKTHSEFASATVDQIFDRDFNEVPSKVINTVQHMLFINTGNGFTAQPLPPEAQFSTVLNAGVADFDNDGNEDIFLGQNFFAFPDNIPHQDAGRGLILMGDGQGNFTPLSGNESGIKLYGEQRGAALGDFNEDGSVDLVVTQNNDQTRLFENRTENPGIRVRLNGPENNSDAIGSGIRIVYSDGTKGPRRDIQAGSGYWSQNSKTQVLGTREEPAAIEVTWFNGTVTEETLPDGVREIVIEFE